GESITPGATHTIDMVDPALSGIGLVEAIPASAILRREAPEDADGDGISGRAGRTPDGGLARFGQKGTDGTLRDFVEGALLQEMGITTSAHPRELSVNGRPVPPEADPAEDPEFGDDRVELLVDYLRFLAPPEPLAADSVGPVATTGRRLFRRIGCADCHTPGFTTRADAPAPLSARTVALYSDLLLHDLGPDTEGICSPSASPREVRTAPLMGLRLRPLLTHDGESATLLDVLRRHGGEAGRSARAFAALTPTQRAALLQFLGTL
ncbi:MAG: di-heme oxidoredictase family protein, partial [Gemmatimonadota bacterium]